MIGSKRKVAMVFDFMKKRIMKTRIVEIDT
jgi:hypothetical protein